MTASTPSGGNANYFRHAKRYFAELDPATTGRLIASGADVALVIEGGVIRDVALGNQSLAGEDWAARLRGKPWLETVTDESRDKIDHLLKAAPADRGRWRQVNHPVPEGLDLPVSYTTVRAGTEGRVVALGRDLRSVAHLQQRLLSAHQELDREYAALREAEARYRHLFNVMSEGVAIVAARSRRLHDLNPSAAQLLDLSPKQATDVVFADLFDASDRERLDRMMADAMTRGEASLGGVALPAGTKATCHASAFREGPDLYLIVRMETEGADRPAPAPNTRDVHRILEHLPDGFIVTTASLRILSVNGTFLEAVRAVDDRQVIGEPLSHWLGRSAAELSMLVSNLKHHGTARNFATIVRDRFGMEEDVEVSGVAAPLGLETAYGFSVRRRPGLALDTGGTVFPFPRSAEQVTNQVGRVPLKEIVREATDTIERLCIETALDIADDSRASAAEILGLSRQGLYSKLKRFGIDDAD